MSKPSEEVWQAETLDDPTGTAPFLVEWARESAKASIPFANELLRNLVILDTALLGGGMYFFKPDVMAPLSRAVVALFFILSLCFAFGGTFPCHGRVPLNSPLAIAEHKNRAIANKFWWLKGAAFFLVLGFAFALIGIAMGAPPAASP